MSESYKERFKAEAEAAAKAVIDFANNMSHDSESFAEYIANDHRTLQSQTISLFIQTIYRVAENDTDLRNEVAVAKCKDIVAMLGYKGYLVPFI